MNGKSASPRPVPRLVALLLVVLAGATGPLACSRVREAAPEAAGKPPVRQVGPGKKYSRPSEAAAAARNGDVIEIDAGIYSGDVAIWRANDLVIRGVGGRPHLKAAGNDAEDKGIWVIKGRNATVENIEFSGAAVRDRNGAGIRQEGVNLTVRNCYFHDNENGILAGKNPESEVLIEYSEFARNGDDGQQHNIYVGQLKRLTLQYSYSHHAEIGHNVKSRALETRILYNRLTDEASGRVSYSIDIPQGGIAYVIGNLIQQGLRAENLTLVSYGAEGLKNPVNELYVINNTLVNEGPPAGGRFLFIQQGTRVALVTNNIFAGPGTLMTGPGTLDHNLVSNTPGLVDTRTFDYHLKATSAAVDKGAAPGTANGFPLTPTHQYVHPAAAEARPNVSNIDIGAYEYGPASP